MITELTKEQTEALAVYRNKWIKIGLATGRANRERAEQAINAAYVEAGLKPPGKFEWFDSPMAGAKRAAELQGTGTYKDQLSQACYGSHDAGWLSFYDYAASELKIQEAERLRPLMTAAEEVGWFWCFDECCVVTERPTVCKTDEQGRLDCRTGPAVLYGDGLAVYSVGGTVVPEHVVEGRNELTADEVEAISNLEVRRVAIELMGIKRYVETGNFTVVDKDTDSKGNQRELLKRGDMLLCHVVNSTSEEYAKGLRGIKTTAGNSTFREYFIRIEPECRPLISLTEFGQAQKLTCKNAIASLAGMTGEEYDLIEET